MLKNAIMKVPFQAVRSLLATKDTLRCLMDPYIPQETIRHRSVVNEERHGPQTLLENGQRKRRRSPSDRNKELFSDSSLEKTIGIRPPLAIYRSCGIRHYQTLINSCFRFLVAMIFWSI
jgi:hypothetical protein